MMRLRAAITGVLVMACAAGCAAQDWAKAALAKSPRHGEYVTIAEPDGRKLQAFVVYPEIATKAPVVVLIHEIFGESDWFKEMADEIAGAGYIVIAPDLLSGLGPAPVQAARMQQQPAQPTSNVYMPHCDPMPCPNGTITPPPPPPDHSHMTMPAQAGAAYTPAEPGGTSAFPDQQAVVRAVTSLPDAQVAADPRRRRRLRQETARSQRQTLRRWLLLGRRQELSIRHAPQGPERGLRLLRPTAGGGLHEEHHGAGVRLLRRQ